MAGTAPTGFQTPKTDWTAANAPVSSDLNRIEGNAQATELGNRTIDPTVAPTGIIGTLRQLLDWFANRIMAITGLTSWYGAPAITLADAKTHVDATAAGVHGSTAVATANKLAHRDVNGDLQVRRLVSTMADGTAPLTVTSKTVVTNLNADKLDGLDATSFPTILSGGSKVQSGKLTRTWSSGTAGSVTFPTAFSAAPIVVVTPAADDETASAYSITSTGFTIHCSITDGSSQSVNWIAIGT